MFPVQSTWYPVINRHVLQTRRLIKGSHGYEQENFSHNVAVTVLLQSTDIDLQTQGKRSLPYKFEI